MVKVKEYSLWLRMVSLRSPPRERRLSDPSFLLVQPRRGGPEEGVAQLLHPLLDRVDAEGGPVGQDGQAVRAAEGGEHRGMIIT